MRDSYDSEGYHCLLAWFKLFCKQIGQLQMPGDE